MTARAVGARPDGHRRVDVAAAVVMAVATVALAAIAWGGFFYQDDFLFLGQAHDSSMSLSYLREGAFGHFFPGFRAVFWLQDRTVGLDHHAIVVAVALSHLACMVMMWRLLTALFGRRPGSVMLLGMFGFSGLWLSGYLWWVSAIQVMPAMLFTLVVLDAHVRYVETRRGRHVLVAAAGLALALCFYEKPAQLVVMLPLLTLLAFSAARTLREATRELLGLWPMWLGFAIVLLVYAVAYLTGDFFVATVHPSPGTLARTIALGWHQGFVPAFLGGSWTLIQHGSLGYPDPTRLHTIAAQVLLVALVAWSVWFRRSAWRGWAYLVVAFVINVAVIAWTRGGLLGSGVGRELKYLIDILPFAVVGVGLAFLPVRFGPRPALDAPAPGRRDAIRIHGAVGAAAVLAFLGVFAVSAARVGRYWHGGDSARFGRAFDRTRAALPHGPAAVYLDVDMPETVLASAFQPYQRQSVLLRLFGTSLRYAGQATRTELVEPGGEARTVTLPVQASTRAAGATIDGQPLAARPDGSLCLKRDDAPHLISIPLSAPLPPGRPYLRLVTHAPHPVTLRFPQQGGIGIGAIDPRRRTEPQRVDGSDTPLYLPLESPGASTVDVLLDPGNPVCFDHATVGLPALAR